MLTWIGNDQSMQMRETSRAVDKKLLVNNNVGRALKFYSSVRLDVRRSETVKESGEAVSNKVKIKVVKNKVAPPFKEAVVTIKFGKGLDLDNEIIDVSLANGELVKSGSWFSLKNGERIGQGSESVRKYLNDNPELKARLLEIAKNGDTATDFTPSADELNSQSITELDDNDIVNE